MKKQGAVLIIASVVIAIVAVIVAYFVFLKHQNNVPVRTAPKPSAAVSQTLTARDLAKAHLCTRFSPRLRDQSGAYYSDAHCWIGTQKYGIVMLNEDGLKIWLDTEKKMGIQPTWQGPTWAIYKTSV